MTYYLHVFSPETYEAFTQSNRTVSGFRLRYRIAAERVSIGDKLICYMTKVSRWVGVLEVKSMCFIDDTPLFFEEDDPFVVRFKVEPLAWLTIEKAVPIRDDRVWKHLTFTRNCDPDTQSWTAILRTSLNRLSDEDGQFLEKLILSQASDGVIYQYDIQAYQRLLDHRIRRHDRTVSVSVPQGTDVDIAIASPDELRESIKIQALLAKIGAKMGLRIWIPRNDRNKVLKEWNDNHEALIYELPLNYDETTLRTIEQIDVLWLRHRYIVRAFEVEHTTTIYSGILRMADLLALQPNMDIKLHIVAPAERREKVFQEIRRPVFSLLEKGPLSENCTFISYDSVRNLANLGHIQHLSDSVLEEYAEEAD